MRFAHVLWVPQPPSRGHSGNLGSGLRGFGAISQSLKSISQGLAQKTRSLAQFWLYLGPGRQSAQNEVPKNHSGHIWALPTKVLKMSLLRPIPPILAHRPPKCSKRVSQNPFWPYLGQDVKANCFDVGDVGSIWCGWW